jgi:hypothetical protein
VKKRHSKGHWLLSRPLTSSNLYSTKYASPRCHYSRDR